MDFSKIVRSAVGIASTATRDLQVTVQHQAWISNDVYGAPVYAAAIPRRALVEQTRKLGKTSSGQEQMSRATVTFVSAIPPNGASGRQEPVDPRDLITFHDGHVGEILGTEGMLDPSTGRPYMHVALVG